MKQRYTYILATLMGILLFAGCSDDDMSVALKGDPTEVYVNVTISIGGTQEVTRATVEAPGDGTPALSLEDGSLQDSYIDPEDVELFVFDQNNKFVSRVDIFSRTHMGTTTNVDDPDASTDNYQCLIVGSIEMEDLNNGHYHLVAVCNQNGTLGATQSTLTEGTTTLDDLIDGITYSGYDSDFTGSLLTGHTGTFDKDNINDGNYTQNARIPMWGICTVSLAKGKMVTAPIAVLRSMAKVRVAIGGDAKTNGYQITGVTLNTANTGGTLAAKKNGETVQAYVSAENNNGTADDTNDDFKTYTTAWNSNTVTNITTPSIPSEVNTINSGLTFSKVTENGTDYYVIYIPEYKNVDATTPATITLGIKDASSNAIKDSEGNDYILHFADYSNGATPTAPEWDIIRNDIYDYTITKITETGGLEANVRVMPWQYETMEYELSQNAVVMLTSEPKAVFNYDLYRYSNEVIYSASGDKENYATFTIKVKEPKGVRWNAHLTNPYFFTFTSDSETYGFGGTDKEYTITVKPRGKFTEVMETDLFFTVETLIGGTPQIAPVDADGKFITGNYGITSNGLHIAQVKTRSGDTTDDTVPFTVVSSLFNEADTAELGLDYPDGIVTVRMYNPAKDGSNGYNNGVVMTEFNGSLYCMWQTSQVKEDAPETYVAYNSCPITNETAISSNISSIAGDLHWKNGIKELCPDVDASSDAFSSSGGWLVNDDNNLVAYINTWPKNLTYGGGYTRYMTSADGSSWSTPTELTFGGGNAIFEQDPHVIELPDGTKRIVNAAHFQGSVSAAGGLYVTPIYAPWNDGGISGWVKGTATDGKSAFEYDINEDQSRQMEPSLYQKENGTLVMVFRDNLEIDGTYTHKLYASMSKDYGETWTKPILTNMPDSKSKQCAGNLPDGTAYMINNPRASINRSPLVITLSADGTTFTKAYLLRSGKWMNEEGGGYDDTKGYTGVWDGKHMQYPEIQTERRSKVKNDAKISALRYGGYHYPKAMVHGDYLYVSYSTNKEDVEYTRIPLSSIQLNDPSAR